VCRKKALVLQELLIINHEICSLCGQCMKVCPFGAIELKDINSITREEGEKSF